MKVLFCGTGSFGLPSLRALLAGPHRLLAVLTQPDRRSGRARRKPLPIPREAAFAGLPILSPDRCNDPAVLEEISALAPDVAVVVAYGQLIGRPLLAVPPHGWINLHASLLPEYRGAAPIARALLEGRRRTGVTIFRLDPGLDAGDVLASQPVDIRDDETAEDLEPRLAAIGAPLILRVLDDLASGHARPVSQDHDKATFAPVLSKEEGRIDWNEPARRIANMVRAFAPWPGAQTAWRDAGDVPHPFLIRKAHVRKAFGKSPGTVLSASPDGLVVACGEDAIVITELQPAGSRRMSAAAFLNGHDVCAGHVLSGGRRP
ncbi:MAG: methionyl-tRNA formyltransferase [Planctomycetota bacterium]